MPATNMGSANGSGNPSTGKFVIMDPFSGPKGSPRDNDKAGNYSTGALSTGIGFGAQVVIGPIAPRSINERGFSIPYVPGITMPGGTAAPDARLLAIGGGKSTANSNGYAPTVPYAAQPILGFGNGGSRDGGAGPAYTGFGMSMQTAIAATAIGADIVAGYANRSSVALVIGQSSFGSAEAASAAVT